MTLEALEYPSSLAFAPYLNTTPQSDARIAIRLASSEAELYALYRFRYTVYMQEANTIQVYANHAKQIIEDPFDQSAYNFAAFRGNEVVGTLRVNFSRDSDLAYYEKFLDMYSVGSYHPSATSISTRLMVERRLRGSSVAVRLAQASYAFALYRQIRYNFLDCNDRMVRFFGRLGYVRQGYAEHPDYGFGAVMRLDLLDRINLIRTRSPFLDVLDSCHEPSVLGVQSGLA